MKTYYKSYEVTASITDRTDGSAKLIVRDSFGKQMRNKVHKNRNAALAAWKRMC